MYHATKFYGRNGDEGLRCGRCIRWNSRSGRMSSISGSSIGATKTGVAKAGGTDSVGSSSCCGCSTYGGTEGIGLGGAPRGAE